MAGGKGLTWEWRSTSYHQGPNTRRPEKKKKKSQSKVGLPEHATFREGAQIIKKGGESAEQLDVWPPERGLL